MSESLVRKLRSVDGARTPQSAPVQASHGQGTAAARAGRGADSRSCPANAGPDQYTPSSGGHRAAKPHAPRDIGPDNPWSNAYSLEGTTNAHRTNTPEEMEAALEGDTQWFEGDCRLGEDGKPVMAHDKGATDGLSLEEWLEVGGDSGRGLKLEVKEPEHMDKVLEEIKRSGFPSDRLMINLGADDMAKWGPKIREQCPDAILAISVPGGELTPQKLDQILAQADGLDGRKDGNYDGRLAFVLNETQVSDEAIRRLEPVAPVSVWNNPGVKLPGDTPPSERIRDLQERGVTGVIDIREDDSVLKKGGDVADKAWDATWDTGKKAAKKVWDVISSPFDLF